jgi:hypothetical protein
MIQFSPMLASLLSGAGSAAAGGMIGGTGMSTGASIGGSALGGAGGSTLGGFGSLLASGSLLGTKDRVNSSGTSSFDISKLPDFYRSLEGSDQASRQLMELIRQLGGQRQQALQGNLDNQIAAVQGYGGQALRDINQRYNSAQGGVGQSLTNRGLYNSTVAPGMSALVNRERNNALGQETDRQRQYFGGLLGQRAQLLDRATSEQNNALAQVGSQDYGLRAMIPQAIANSRVSTDNQVNRKGGIFSRLFG